MDKEYNGWSTYETWAVNMWIGGTEGSTNYWDNEAKELLERNDNDVEELKDELAAALVERNRLWGIAKTILDNMLQDAKENLIVLKQAADAAYDAAVANA